MNVDCISNYETLSFEMRDLEFALILIFPLDHIICYPV